MAMARFDDSARHPKLGGVWIEDAIFGTGTGGRIEDFRVAATLLKRRKFAPNTRMIKDVYRHFPLAWRVAIVCAVMYSV
jgi:hypothetical protein